MKLGLECQQNHVILPILGPAEETAPEQNAMVLPPSPHHSHAQQPFEIQHPVSQQQGDLLLITVISLDPARRQVGNILPEKEELQHPASQQLGFVLPDTPQVQNPDSRQAENAIPGNEEHQSTTRHQNQTKHAAAHRTHEPATQQEQAIFPIFGPDEDPAQGQNAMVLPPCHQKSILNKEAYIDDLTMLEKICLLDLVEKDPIIGPPDFHDRFHLTLPPDRFILQHKLEDLKIETKKNSMLLNKKKTKSLLFTTTKTRDFMPQLSLEEGTFLEVVFQIKLVGLVITTDMSWDAHINYTIKRVNSVLW